MFKQKKRSINFEFVEMTLEYASEIAYKWKYSGKYAFYNMSKDEEDLKKFLSPTSWENIFASVDKDSHHLVGFTTYSFENNIMWIGFGLKPNYTGKGYGEDFVRSAILFGLEHYNYNENKILLSVAEFNKRATKIYQKVGFKYIESKELLINGKLHPFLIMGMAI